MTRFSGFFIFFSPIHSYPLLFTPIFSGRLAAPPGHLPFTPISKNNALVGLNIPHYHALMGLQPTKFEYFQYTGFTHF
jgi:hypothetical protein